MCRGGDTPPGEGGAAETGGTETLLCAVDALHAHRRTAEAQHWHARAATAGRLTALRWAVHRSAGQDQVRKLY